MGKNSEIIQPKIRAKKHVPTDENRRMVTTMAGIGVPLKMIAVQLGMSEPTLAKYYQPEIDTGIAKATSAISKRLYDIAMGDSKESLTAIIFFLKCRAGWSTRDAEGSVNVNIQNNTAIIANRTNNELEQFRQRWESTKTIES